MTIQLGETAPDFTAETTEGRLNLSEYLGDHWGAVLPSGGLHPGLHH